MSVHSLPISGHTIDTATGADGFLDDVTPTRQCGRCRLHFPVPADTHPMELRDWWTCSNCSEALLPARTTTQRAERHRGPT